MTQTCTPHSEKGSTNHTVAFPESHKEGPPCPPPRGRAAGRGIIGWTRLCTPHPSPTVTLSRAGRTLPLVAVRAYRCAHSPRNASHSPQGWCSWCVPRPSRGRQVEDGRGETRGVGGTDTQKNNLSEERLFFVCVYPRYGTVGNAPLGFAMRIGCSALLTRFQCWRSRPRYRKRQ